MYMHCSELGGIYTDPIFLVLCSLVKRHKPRHLPRFLNESTPNESKLCCTLVLVVICTNFSSETFNVQVIDESMCPLDYILFSFRLGIVHVKRKIRSFIHIHCNCAEHCHVFYGLKWFITHLHGGTKGVLFNLETR